MKGKMRAQLFYGPGDVRYEHIDITKIKSNEVLAKIKSAFTCGSDLKTYRRGHPTMIEKASVFGHEWAGDIVEKGSEVNDFKVWDRIVAVNSVPCYNNYYCSLGRYSLCENLVYNNGAYAEYIKVPGEILEKNTYKIPEKIKYMEAALLEPLACVIHSVEEYHINAGNAVVINGARPIGLMFVALAKLKGAVVISVDPSEERLGYTKEFGEDYVVNVRDVEDHCTL